MTRFAILLLFLASTTGLSAQTILTDVNPDFSTLHDDDPDGATGGRVNGTAVDPNNSSVMYAASEWGGLYKTLDGGNSWFRLDGHRAVATWDVEIDPSNTNRVYATSFYDGRSTALSGINVSTDGGTTWTRPAIFPPGGFCTNSADQTELTAFGISIDPTDSSDVYVGTSCGLAFTTNSGTSWSYASPFVGAGKFWDVLVSQDGAFVDTCGDHGHQIYVTATGTWVAGFGLASGRCSLAGSPYSTNGANLFAVVGTSFFETVNGGSSWTNTRTNPSPQGRIPFVATNQRSGAGAKFDLWFGDVSLHSVACDAANPIFGFSCGGFDGANDVPAWSQGFTRFFGGHDDTGSLLFDPSAANDACPILLSSDGGVYYNDLSTSPGCQTPSWMQPSVTPHGLWPFAMAGANRAGQLSEDLYFGNQDNGVFGATNAGSDSPTWENQFCCDGFDTAADDFDDGTIFYSACCFSGGRSTKFFRANAGFVNQAEINYPPSGLPPGFKNPDAIVNWADNSYVMVTADCTLGSGGCPGTDGGVYITQNADGNPITWTQLGPATEPPSSEICAVRAGVDGNTPTFYVRTGTCNSDSSTDNMFKFVGTNPGGTWSEIFLPQGGFGVFNVSPTDPDRLLAAGFTGTDAFTYKSVNGGASWTPLPALDAMMDGGGAFPMKNLRGPTNFTSTNGYHQPSLLAIDPSDPDILIGGGRDSGIFASADGGTSWTLLTDPTNSHTSGTPHIPRPWHAYFDEEGGRKSVFIASQGRGIWRMDLIIGSCSPDVVLQNQTVNGTQSFGALNSVTAGPSFTVSATGTAHLTAGQEVILRNGTTVEGDMTIGLSATPCP